MSINAQPFSPTFKLVGNLSDSQILVYDASENAFVNATNTGATGGAGLTTVLNTGTGVGLGQATGTALELKSIIAGTNLTITDNGTALVLDVAGASQSGLTDGTNLGTGLGLIKGNNTAGTTLETKSITVGTGLSISEANDTLTIDLTANVNGMLEIANNLSDVADTTTARTNLDVYSKAETDSKYIRLDAHSIPTVDNTFDIGSSLKRFNDIYAETFQGTALLADNLTIVGSAQGEVLTWNGSTWVASQPTGGGGGGGAGVPQTLSLLGQSLTISGGNTITLPSYNDDDPFVRLDQSTVPTVTNTFDIGSSTYKFNDIYAETFQGTAVAADTLTVTGNAGQVLTYNGSQWLAADPQGAGGGGSSTPQTLALNGTQIAISSGNSVDIGSLISTDYNNLSNKPTIPADVSDLTDTSSLLAGTPQSLTLAGTQLTISSGNTVDFAGMFTDTDNQTLSFNTGTNILTIANGNTVDLSTLAGGGGASQLADLSDVDAGGVGGMMANVPQNGEVLTWSQINSQWEPQPANSAVTSSDLDMGGNKVLFANVYATLGDLPSATTYHGMFAHVHATGKGYFAHAGNWVPLANEANIPADVSDLTDTNSLLGGGSQTLALSGTQLTISGQNTVDFAGMFTDTDNQTLSFNTSTNILTIANGNTVDLSNLAGSSNVQTIDDLSDVTVTGTTDGQFLVYNNTSGDWENQTVNIPTSNQALSTTDNVQFAGIQSTGTVQAQAFEGNIYDTNGNVLLDNTSGSAGFGGNISSNGSSSFSGTVDFNGATIQNLDISLGDLSNVSTATPTTGHVLKWTGTEWSPAADSTATGGAGISLTDLSAGVGLQYNNTLGLFTLNAAMTDLLDVDTSGITNGQVLKWNSSASQFEPENEFSISTTDDVAEGSSNYYYTTARFDSNFNSKSTDDLPGGATNLYYTDALVDNRVNVLLQAGPGINILPSPTPGAPITIENTNVGTTYTDADARNAISVSTGAASGSGGLAYNSSTGAFTFAPADLSSYSTFSGDYDDLTNKPSIVTLNALSVSNGTANGGGSLAYNSASGQFTFTPPDLSTYSTFDGDYNNLTNTPSLFDGAYSSLTGAPTIPSALSDLTMPSGTTGQVLTTDGSGNFSFSTVSGGGSSYGDSDVETYMGQFDFHILPDTNATYDIGSASNKIRHLFLSDNSLYIGDNTLNTTGSNLMFNSQDVMDYTNIKNKPTIPTDVDDLTDAGNLLGGTSYTAGTGLQLNTNTFSLNANIGDLQNVSATAPSSGQVLSWTGSEWAPAAAGGTPNLSSSSVGDLNDVNISGISAGQYLEWDGTKFVAASASAADLTSESITELSDVSTDTPNNGDVLTWNSGSSSYAPAAPSGGGGGGGGTSTERFKLNYATNGSLSSISNASTGVSATILSTTGGDVEITFSGHSYPPANILIYGYARASNQYVIMPLNKDISTRTVAGGGVAGSPTAFGSLGSSVVTLKLREADTGASRSFGTDTHAWIMFTMM